MGKVTLVSEHPIGCLVPGWALTAPSMLMIGARPAQQPCPACQQPNEAAAEYCWACHLDLKPDAPVALPVAAATPTVAAAPLGPRARRLQGPSLDVPAPAESEPPPPSLALALALLAASTAIVGGSWLLFSQTRPVPITLFAAAWGIVLAVSLLARKLLPAPPPGWRNYYSLNPFEYRDNWNRWLRSVRIWTFLPSIVIATFSAWRDLLLAPRRG